MAVENTNTQEMLSEEELELFRQELLSEDEDFEEISSRAEESLRLAESLEDDEYVEETPEEKMQDNAWAYSKVWEQDSDTGKYICKGVTTKLYTDRKANQDAARAAGRAKHLENTKLRRLKKIEIQRQAFDQKILPLEKEFRQEHKVLLIELLTAEHKRMMEKCSQYITNRISTLLRPLIPQTLRNCYKRWPDSFKRNPGFMYVANKEYGENKQFWVVPNIPYFFVQGTEMEVLHEHREEYLYQIDRVLLQYLYHQQTLREKEVKYATRLLKISKNTYFGLLKLNPFWFDLLYTEISKEKGAE